MQHGMEKKILVTGAGGYIGIVLLEELLRKGYRVRALDTFYFGKKNFNHLRGKIETIQQDIRNVDESVLKGIHTVIHQAGLSNDPMADFNPKANFEINTKATIQFARMCKKNGVKRFTFASSASIYDRGINGNQELQNENSKVNPTAAYSLSKYKAEQALLNLADKNFCPVIFRQGTVYGFSPRMRYDLVVNTMLKTALSTGKLDVFCGGRQWRPLVDVRDVVHGHILAVEAPEEKVCGQIFNLVYKNYRILELAKHIQKALKKQKKLTTKIVIDHSLRKDRSYRISGEKIQKILNWIPQTSVETSIADMIRQIEKWNYTNYSNPRYYNIEWMMLLNEYEELIKKLGRVF